MNIGKQRHQEVTSPAQGGFVVMSELGCGPGVLRPLQFPLQGHVEVSSCGHLSPALSSARGTLPIQATAAMAPSSVPQKELGKIKIKVRP